VRDQQGLGRERDRQAVAIDADGQSGTLGVQTSDQLPLMLKHAVKPLQVLVHVATVAQLRSEDEVVAGGNEPRAETA